MNNISLFIIFTSLLLLGSCYSEPAPSKAVVKVFDRELSLSDLQDQIGDELSPEDSVILAQNIMENWVKTTMLIAQAERNLPDSLKDFSKQLEAEKNSLLLYTYENEYIKQRLDTNITSEEILSHYNRNAKSFILSDYILRYNLLKVYAEAENVNPIKIKKLLSLDSLSPELELYASDIGATYSFSEDTTNWIYLEEFLEQVPIEVYNNESFLKKQKFADFESENFRYFVYVKDYELKDKVAPIELVTKKIKTLILNQRKQLMLKTLRADLYQKAVRENQIHYYK